MAEKLSGTPKWDTLAPGVPGALSEEQSAQLKLFLSRVPADQMEAMRFPLEPPEYFGCRVLRARRFDVDEALKCVAETVAWRKEQRVRDLATTSPVDILGGLAPDEIQHFHQKTYLPYPDKEGRPIYIEKTGTVDSDILLTLATAEQFERHHIHCLETDVRELYSWCTQRKNEALIAGGKTAPSSSSTSATSTASSSSAASGSAEGGSAAAVGGAGASSSSASAATSATVSLAGILPEATVTTMVSILDMEGMSMKIASTSARNYVAGLSKIASSYYPETMGKMFIINAPAVFTVAWAMVKGFLDERTVRKIEILGGPSAWQPRFAEFFDLSVMPVEYGGKLRIQGGLFRPSRTRSFALPTSRLVQYIAPAKAGDSIRFKWLSLPGDIKFSVSFYEGDAPAHVKAAPDHESQGHLSDPLTAADADAALGGKKPSKLVYALKDHPGSDKAWVTAGGEAPSAGYFVATFDNTAGWRSRDVHCRWDVMKDGKPVAPFSYNLCLKPQAAATATGTTPATRSAT